MRILILDDTQANLDAAAEQLKGHELVLVSSFSRARKRLSPSWDNEKKKMVPGERFDIVLTDLFLPGEKEGQGDKGYAFIGEPVPTGLALALLALKVGVGKVAVVSNGNHHHHPLTWALDALQERNKKSRGEVNVVLPGRLWSFTGYECPTTEENRDVKDWAVVFSEITKT